MQISMTARHFEPTSGLRQFATQRLEKLQKFASDIHGVHLVVSQDKTRYEAEITLRVNGNQLVATETHTEPGAAVERAADRLELQLRKLKERRVEHKVRKDAAAPEGAASEAGDDEIADEE